MKLFGKKEEINEEKKSCCCGNITQAATESAEKGKKEQGIKVLGSGCAKCIALEKAVRTAVTDMGLETDITHVTDFAQIAAYGVMTTPALLVNGKVVSYGKVLTAEEVKQILEEIYR